MTDNIDTRLREQFNRWMNSSNFGTVSYFKHSRREAFLADMQRLIDAGIEEGLSEVQEDNDNLRERLTELKGVLKDLHRDKKADAEVMSQRLAPVAKVTARNNRVVNWLMRRYINAPWKNTSERDLNDARVSVLVDALREMTAQDLKWGANRKMPNGTGAPLFTEDLADMMRQRTDEVFRDGEGTWQDILTEEYYEAMAETHPRQLREELIQVAAVCLQWVLALKTQKSKR